MVSDRAVSQGALTGAMIAGMFGVVWTAWGSSGVTGAASVTVRIAGVLAGLVIVLWSVRLWRSASRARGSSSSARPAQGSRSMFSSPGYLVVVALEVVAIGGGNAVLGASGHNDYVIAWVATVIGMHFIALGRLFYGGFYWLGTMLIAAGIAGATVGFADGGSDAIKATSGLIAAASLFVAGGRTLIGAQAAGARVMT